MNKKTIISLSLVIVSALLLTACSHSESATKPTESATPEMAQPATQEPATQVVTDGKTITTDATYTSPAGEEKITFTLIVNDDGVITDAVTAVKATAPKSVERQQKFAEGLPEAVKGKKLADLSNIDRVGGSSLTTEAFNKALTQLKAQL